jgi:hypothetical protein
MVRLSYEPASLLGSGPASVRACRHDFGSETLANYPPGVTPPDASPFQRAPG